MQTSSQAASLPEAVTSALNEAILAHAAELDSARVMSALADALAPSRFGAVIDSLRDDTAGSRRYRIGACVFIPGRFELRSAEGSAEPVRLTEKEEAMLSFMIEQGGGPVSRQAMLEALWHYAPGATTHTVESHIYRLRRKLETFFAVAEPANAGNDTLLTVDIGYQLIYTPH